MTRAEHLKWCKKRAIIEYDYYFRESGSSGATRNGLTSMMSDMGKHDGTRSDAVTSLCMMQMMRPMTRQQFIDFINGFN